MADVLKDSQTTNNDSEAVAKTSGNLYYATSFVAGSSYTLTKVALFMTKAGAPDRLMTCYIYSDNGSDVPDSVLATSSNTVNMSAYTSTPGWEGEWTFAGLALTNGTKYHIVVYCATYDADNFVYWNLNAGATGTSMRYSGNGTSWTAYDTSSQGDFRTYADEGSASSSPSSSVSGSTSGSPSASGSASESLSPSSSISGSPSSSQSPSSSISSSPSSSPSASVSSSPSSSPSPSSSISGSVSASPSGGDELDSIYAYRFGNLYINTHGMVSLKFGFDRNTILGI